MVLAAMMVGASCVWVNGGRSAGDVTILWSFGTSQLGCPMVPEVTRVTVRIPGQILENGGTYGCLNGTGGVAGITLLDFAAGTYSYTVQGKNDADFVLYEASGSFTVNGSITVNTVLMPAANAPGGAYLTWTLDGGHACVWDLDVTSVRAIIDGTTTFDFNCSDGQTQPGVLITNLLGGVHQITLAARTQQGFTYYYRSSTLTIVPGTNTAQLYDLLVGGGLAVRWTFPSQQSCAQVGVDNIYVNLIDANSALVYADPGLAVPCDLQNPPGLTFEFLYVGNYWLSIRAPSRSGVVYSTSQQNPPPVQVVARTFPSIDTAPWYPLLAH